LEQPAGGLPQRLKAATREAHAHAERSGVMGALLAGSVARADYIALLANLSAIYRALEPALERLAPRWPGFGALARTAALEADLRAFGAGPTPLAPATLGYVERLDALRGASAHRLWAHVYVRYLGDLHGGQILADRVRHRFALPDGTRFYDFGDAAQVQRLREGVRAQLASVRLDAAETDAVVAEAVWAFAAHCDLFEQIGPTQPRQQVDAR
jgi:heme oxygenase